MSTTCTASVSLTTWNSYSTFLAHVLWFLIFILLNSFWISFYSIKDQSSKENCWTVTGHEAANCRNNSYGASVSAVSVRRLRIGVFGSATVVLEGPNTQLKSYSGGGDRGRRWSTSQSRNWELDIYIWCWTPYREQSINSNSSIITWRLRHPFVQHLYMSRFNRQSTWTWR